MNSNITIIPSDYMVSIDGEALHLDFTIDPSIHAIQWKNGAGEIEYVDASKQNLKLKSSADYNKYIKSYVDLWNDEKERKEVEANKPPSLEEAKHEKQSEVINKFSAMFAPINAVYPPEEQTSWPEQEKEAALYIAWEQAGKQGKAPETPCLCAILMPGESLEALCQSVMQKGPLFRALRNTLQAQQRVHFHTVAALESSEDVMAYKVEYILPPELEAYLGGQ